MSGLTVRISPGRAQGTVCVPGSKSVAHRLLICAGLSAGRTVVDNAPDSADIAATLDCLAAMGASAVRDGTAVTVTGRQGQAVDGVRMLPCRESGSTLRFFLPLCASDGIPTRLMGTPRLLERPLAPYEAVFRDRGIAFTRDGNGLTVKGRLTAGVYALPGGVSSQFVTGLLFCLPLLDGDSRITLTTPPESASYIGLTLDVLKQFGIDIECPDDRTLLVPGRQVWRSPGRVYAEGDESTAALLGVYNALGGAVTLTGLAPDTHQGDRVWRDLFDACGKGCPTVSMADCPDLAPVLMVLGALGHGIRLTDTRRLRFKESDRGAVMAQELGKCGVSVTVRDNDITVPGGRVYTPAAVLDSHNDHRIAMALAALGSVVGCEIAGAEAVAKSYPAFWAVLDRLGVPVLVSR